MSLDIGSIPLKRIPRILLNKIVGAVAEPVKDRRSARRIEAMHHKSRSDERIKVGFLVQMPEVWDKQQSVYAAMVKDERFDPWLIIVPGYDLKTDTAERYGEEKGFFLSRCLGGSYILARQNDEWIDLSAYGFEYIFYQRPYNLYLPPCLRSDQVARFTRVCYIPYATTEDKKDRVIYPRSFLRDVYFGFMEDGPAEASTMGRFPGPFKRFFNIGYPAFETCLSLERDCRYSRVLWTPRWSYDPVIGGSHFLEYNNPLTDYPWGEHRLTVRPHQLMWGNFIKTGLLTDAQAADIRERWTQAGVRTDANKDILKTFDETDILISDRSSVIPMFFLTGKPVIYCPIETEYSWLFSTILPGLYVAKDWDEVKAFLDSLLREQDPLREKRHTILQDVFSYHAGATERIIEMLACDVMQDEKRNPINQQKRNDAGNHSREIGGR